MDNQSPMLGQTVHHGEKIRNLLEELNIPVDVFAKEYIEKSRAVAYNFLKKPVFSKEEIALMSLLFDLRPSFFDLPDYYFQTSVNTRQEIPPAEGIEECLVYSAVDYASAIDYETFLKKYFTLLITYARKATARFVVHDYCGKIRHVPTSEDYSRYHQMYLNALTEHLADTQTLVYQHILALPFSRQNVGIAPQEAFKKIIPLLFPQTFQHFVQCFLDFGDRFELYAIPMPSRLYSFTIIDNAYAITEYDRYNRFGIATADILFIEKKQADNLLFPTSQIIAAYNNDIVHITRETDRTPKRRITFNRLVALTFDLFRETAEEISDLSQVLEKKRNEQLQQAHKILDDPLYEDGKTQEILDLESKLEQAHQKLADIKAKIQQLPSLPLQKE